MTTLNSRFFPAAEQARFSACTRLKLKNGLQQLFANGRILEYTSQLCATGLNQTQWDVQNEKGIDGYRNYQKLKIAFQVWSYMLQPDRFFILHYFNASLAAIVADGPAMQCTVVFCRVFINELSGILADVDALSD